MRELASVRLHGFTARELKQARATVMAEQESAFMEKEQEYATVSRLQSDLRGEGIGAAALADSRRFSPQSTRVFGGLIVFYNHLLPCHSPYSPSSSMPEATYMLMYLSEASCALSETSETSRHASGQCAS